MQKEKTLPTTSTNKLFLLSIIYLSKVRMANKRICGYIISSAFTKLTKSLYILMSFYQVTIKI